MRHAFYYFRPTSRLNCYPMTLVGSLFELRLNSRAECIQNSDFGLLASANRSVNNKSPNKISHVTHCLSRRIAHINYLRVSWLYAVAMAAPLDPASLFSPSRLSPLSSIESSTPSHRPQPMPTRRKVECYVAPPRLSPSVRELYQPTPDYLGGDPEFSQSDLDVVVGEYPLDGRGKPSHYFVRFKDGLARRVSHVVILSLSSQFPSDIFAYIPRSIQ